MCIYALGRELVYLHHFGYLIGAFGRSIVLQTDASHARVYLDMAAYRRGRVLCERLCLFRGDYALYDIVHGYLMRVLGRSVAENKYLRIGSVIPYGDSLVEV